MTDIRAGHIEITAESPVVSDEAPAEEENETERQPVAFQTTQGVVQFEAAPKKRG